MNITTDFGQEAWHALDAPGAYEWWYFDAEDVRQGLSVVCIWFDGFPFSPFYNSRTERWRSGSSEDRPLPSQHAAFSFQLYDQGRELVSFIKEGPDASFGQGPSRIGVRFENSSFSFDPELDAYLLSLDFHDPARNLRVQGALRFTARRRYEYRRPHVCRMGAGRLHQWSLCLPVAEVTGSLTVDGPPGARRILHFAGEGYHDHNAGTEPMQAHYDRWYWGRAVSRRFELVYYLVWFRRPGCTPLAVMMLNDTETGRFQVLDGVAVGEGRMRRGLFAPLHSRHLHIDGGTVTVDVRHRKALDKGPFYLRFAADVFIDIAGECSERITGISEFLDPAALSSPVMRFFTSCRVLRDGSKGFMYGAYNFFRHQFDWFTRKKL